VVLLEKNHTRKVDGYRPDFVGLTCEDEYVFGYGMDLEGYWRNLPEIRVRLTDGS
jgi:hypoxanthine phosphoribosyltransferase